MQESITYQAILNPVDMLLSHWAKVDRWDQPSRWQRHGIARAAVEAHRIRGYRLDNACLRVQPIQR
jgi:hypothetical protein